MPDEEYEELRKKYVEKLRDSFEQPEEQLNTRQYEAFRQEYLPKPLSWYEQACNVCAKILPISPDKRKRPKIEEELNSIHLQVTPEGVTAFSLLIPLLMILSSFLLFYILPVLLGRPGLLFVTVYVAIVSMLLIIPLGKIPTFLANSWRMRASNQMVLCIFYVVTYMRHTSNLELAIDFAAEHLAPPLSLDMKKIIWNVETEKHESIRESLEEYLETWRNWNNEFIESMHLIESSLVESAEARRVEALDKSLSVMLEETYEKMLHYAHNLKSPLTTLHMLGIILPILGLVILPLMVAFMPAVRWYHILLLYNVTLPILVYFIGRDILSRRPTGYGSSDTEEGNEAIEGKPRTVAPITVAFFVFIALFFIGILPLLFHAANPTFDLVHKGTEDDLREGCFLTFCPVDTDIPEQVRGAKFSLNEYRDVTVNPDTGEQINVGPYGLIATLLSLCIPLAVGLAAGLYFKLRSGNQMKLREQAKKLELEFASALFQLGNRLADGLPLEIAFGKVVGNMPDSVSGAFFTQVSINITNGLSVEDAIFHEKYGALNQYPSNIIESSMKVLVQSAKKGPLIASQAIINVSNYIKEMHRVDERLKDLMADVISSMKSQILFLTPTIAGVVMGITSMITSILGQLGARVSEFQGQAGAADAGAIGSGLLGAFGGGAVPTYFFQIVVGLYVVQIIYVLTVLVNGIENGADAVSERSMLGQHMIHSTLTYTILSFVVILLFNIVAANIVPTA